MKLRHLILGTMWLTLAATAQEGKEFCALEVRLESPEGKPTIGEVIVTPRGGPSQVVFTESGVARFCDVGLELFDVTVGKNRCGEVNVRHLEQTWPSTRTLRIVYQNCHSYAGLARCIVLLRFQRQSGEALQGVRAIGPDFTARSDAQGRAFGYLRPDRKLEVTASKSGFESTKIALACSEKLAEQRVTLSEAKQGSSRQGILQTGTA